MILSLATLVCNEVSITARESDGYINLNLLAQANKKRLGNWMRLEDTKEFLQELSDNGSTPIKSSSIKNHPDFGTWGDPKVALKLASWISKPFEAMVYQWVESLMVNGYAISPTATQSQLGNAAKSSISQITNLETIQEVIAVAEDQQIVAIRAEYDEMLKNLKFIRDCATTDAHEYFKGNDLRNELKEYNAQYAEASKALISERDQYIAEIQVLIDRENEVNSRTRLLTAT